jgi:hypothetical protein
MRRMATFLAIWVVFASSAVAQDCRLALVLALDVSQSMGGPKDRLQRSGLANALIAPEVVELFLSGDPVAIHVFQWSGLGSQQDILDGWHVVDDEADLLAIADAIAHSTRFHGEEATATGAALAYAAGLLAQAPPCRQQTVDISSDGINNQGPEPTEILRPGGAFDDVTVNALIIGIEPDPAKATNHVLTAWFLANVLHGPGAFYEVAFTFADYERAMTRKLIRELESPALSSLWSGLNLT